MSSAAVAVVAVSLMAVMIDFGRSKNSDYLAARAVVVTKMQGKKKWKALKEVRRMKVKFVVCVGLMRKLMAN